MTLIFCVTKSFSQDEIGVLCVDFTINGKEHNKGKYFRPVFESILSNIESPPRLIERSKLSDLILLIQDEKNLSIDINGEIIDRLSAAKVDYVIYGDFASPFTSEDYVFQFEIIKVSGDQLFSKKVSPPVRFSESELAGTSIFNNRMQPIIEKYSFISNVGLLEKDQFVEIKKMLDEKDEKISTLERKINQIEDGDLFKIQFNGSHFSRRGGSTSIVAGGKESRIFEQLVALHKKKEYHEIIQLADTYYRENPGAFWLTPRFFKAIAFINSQDRDTGLNILNQLILESPGDEELMTRIGIIYLQINNEKLIQALYDQLSPQMKYKVKSNLDNFMKQNNK